jgi:hypothetical protein
MLHSLSKRELRSETPFPSENTFIKRITVTQSFRMGGCNALQGKTEEFCLNPEGNSSVFYNPILKDGITETFLILEIFFTHHLLYTSSTKQSRATTFYVQYFHKNEPHFTSSEEHFKFMN